MTTKPKRTPVEKPVEPAVTAAPAAQTSAPTPDAAPEVKQDGLLTEAETRALLERLTPERRAMVSGMVDGLHRKQFFDEMGESSKRREAEWQHKLAAAAEIAEGDALDDVERLSLHIIGNLAQDCYLTREMVRDGGLESIFRTIKEAIREALPMLDTTELEYIAEEEKDKRQKAAAALNITAQ